MHLNLGNLEQALSDSNQAIALNQIFGGAYFTRGRIYETMGKPSQALLDFKSAKKYLPKTHPVFATLVQKIESISSKIANIEK